MDVTGSETAWYAVESHLGSLTFMKTRPSRESLYCGQCDDTDTVYGPIRFTPNGVLALAGVLCGEWPIPPSPWEDAESWLDDVGVNVDRIAHEAPVAVDTAGLKRYERRRLNARWALNGLLPFDRRRCIGYFTTVTRGRLSNDHRMPADPAGLLLAHDFADETDPQTPTVPAPWLGCLLEARMRVVPGYRRRWLDMMDAYPGWRFTPAENGDGRPWRIPILGGGVIAAQWFERERKRK